MKLKSSHRVARASTSPSSSSPGRARRRAETDTRFDQNKSVFDGVQNATKLTLYEGLPHQLFERQELKQERASKPTIIIHHFPFYRETLDVTIDDASKVLSILGNKTSFMPFRGPKKCGGFHPDYCAEIETGTGTSHFLICFGCGEAKIYGPRGELYCDIRGAEYEQLKTLLKKYRKNRPSRD